MESNFNCYYCNVQFRTNSKLLSYCKYCKEIICPDCIETHLKYRIGEHLLIEYNNLSLDDDSKYTEKDIKKNFEQRNELENIKTLNIIENLFCGKCSCIYKFKVIFTNLKFKIILKCLCESKEFTIQELLNQFLNQSKTTNLNQYQIINEYYEIYNEMKNNEKKILDVINENIIFFLKCNKSKKEVDSFFDFNKKCYFENKEGQKYFDLFHNYNEIDFKKINYYIKYFNTKIKI
jgi:hypothetical protein